MVSLFDLFKHGIGPSSSHTTGSMTATGNFHLSLLRLDHAAALARIKVTLFGSLAWTGRGHGTTERSGAAPSARRRECLCDRRERGERGGRPCGHGADKWRAKRNPCSVEILPRPLPHQLR
jgi:hypothetical protein